MWVKWLPALKKYSLTIIVGLSIGLLSTSPLLHGRAVERFLNLMYPRGSSQGSPPGSASVNWGTYSGSVPQANANPGGDSGGHPGENSGDNPDAPGVYPSFPDVEVDAGRGFTVLLVGVDNRPGEGNISNTDTLILANYMPTAKRLALLSVPRDTQITYPGFGKQKINAAARLGKGLKSTVKITENLLGQTINGYIKVNFAGFKEIIDTLGGITLTVEKDMYYNTGDKVDGIINLKKGTQRLSGTQALQYARFRHDNLADISRTMRQQAVIKAIVKEALQAKTLTKLPRLIPQAYRAVETDLSLGQMFAFWNLVRSGEGVEMVSQTLPGSFVIEEGISYWKVRLSESRVAVRSLFQEGKTQSIFSGQADDKAWGSWIEKGDAVLPVMSPDVFGETP
ncbi:MAG: LCP family protein [Desulfitobacteriaceae bacterium]|nr:LCP family protein [Desulfitobacteriaceae bacterium]MDI6880376.1 LCP family protein [Desulfitobacteriaceae bacterium]MDI6914615.1 LCP family protein [Desulfitobacteriaceae bacterium]